jgi:hypothetical protein
MDIGKEISCPKNWTVVIEMGITSLYYTVESDP